MAIAYNERLKAEREAKKAKEIAKLEKVIEDGNNDSVVEAAVRILMKNSPKLLNMDEIKSKK